MKSFEILFDTFDDFVDSRLNGRFLCMLSPYYSRPELSEYNPISEYSQGHVGTAHHCAFQIKY